MKRFICGPLPTQPPLSSHHHLGVAARQTIVGCCSRGGQRECARETETEKASERVRHRIPAGSWSDGQPSTRSNTSFFRLQWELVHLVDAVLGQHTECTLTKLAAITAVLTSGPDEELQRGGQWKGGGVVYSESTIQFSRAQRQRPYRSIPLQTSPPTRTQIKSS